LTTAAELDTSQVQVGHAHLTNVVFITIYHLRLSIAEAEFSLPERSLRVAYFHDNDSHFRNDIGKYFAPALQALKKPLLSEGKLKECTKTELKEIR